MISGQLAAAAYDFISESDRRFISEFDRRMEGMGYTCGDAIVPGICWGRYMLIYRRTGAKSRAVYARVYICDASIALRLFLSGVDRHADYIAAAPEHIRHPFTGPDGACRRCKDECRFRKEYDIAGVHYQKCNGETFTFGAPELRFMDDYMALLGEFFPQRRRAAV